MQDNKSNSISLGLMAF